MNSDPLEIEQRRAMTPKPHPQPSEDAVPKLLPCPHCGKPAGIMQAAGVFQAFCGDHQCLSIQTYETRDEAVKAWNTRASPAPTGDSEAGQPTADDITHFVAKVREVDKNAAVNHYVRTGQSIQGAPDDKVVRVLAWLESGAALRAQPPQPTGDVGELVGEAYAVARLIETKAVDGLAAVETLRKIGKALESADSRFTAQTEAQTKAVRLYDALAHLLDRYRDVVHGSTWSDDYDDIPRAEKGVV